MPEKKTVLIVDDHPFVLRGMKSTIEATGMFGDIQGAETAEEALQLAKQSPPHVAVIDITLPDMDGIQLTREFHTIYPEMRILIVSMHIQQNYVIESFHAGARGYVVKQSSTNKFLDALRCVAQGDIFIDGKVGIDVSSILADTHSENIVRDTAYTTLSPREQQVMLMLVEGKTCREIGEELSISSRTADVHRASILKKLALENNVELVRYATAIGLIDIAPARTESE